MADLSFLKELNNEKQDIIKTDGNVLVTANPGTGKTKLLAYKYAYLIAKGLKPEEILCLTFTNKAKKELEERIIKQLKDLGLDIDFSKLNVHTFHSYALDYVDEDEVVSSNMLRYAIYQYLKENDVLNYADSYLIENIVPKMENLLRYLKSFGITPEKIDLKKLNKFLEGDEKHEKHDLETFAEHFLDIYKHYEKMKSKKGIDYADMLLKFIEIKNPPHFEYVLIDELQDVNTIEADMALMSGKYFVAVGDKKQAIFGFQGGSIVNFKKFEKAKKFVLSENFRSAQEVLDYSRDFFLGKSKDQSHKEDLINLKNAEGEHSSKPEIYSVARDELNLTVCELIKQLSQNGKKVAVITRTNGQISKLSKALKDRGIDHSSTFFSASGDAKSKMILFLKGLLTNDLQIVKNSMFTPFFPVSVQQSFDIANEKTKTLEEIYKLIPEYKKLRGSVKNLNDLLMIFNEKVMPVSLAYGREYLLAALNVQEALQEALKFVEDVNLKNLIDYLESSNLLTDGSEIEKQIVLTTVHKAKGKEYDSVIYIPSKTKNNSNFQDSIVEAILKSHGINAEEELDEEALRIDFVAFTRAKSRLCIVIDKPEDYLIGDSVLSEIQVQSVESSDFSERSRRAYNLFLNKEYDKAKELLEINKAWIIDYIKNHFANINHISFSGLQDKAFDYLMYRILKVKEITPSTTLGTDVHEIARRMCIGEKIGEIREELIPFKNNIAYLLKQIRENYPENESFEEKIQIDLKNLIKTEENINFEGFIDAIFKNKDNYLIIDWKTDKNTDRSSKHRQQLEAYRNAFAIKKGINPDKVKVGVGFVGLRKPINDGNIEFELDDKQPGKTAFNTFAKKVNQFLAWKNNPNSFFEDLISENVDDDIWRAVVEQYQEEKKKGDQ
jgi:DNA helicase-2/ATP-dependent DNA helicase PcrA